MNRRNKHGTIVGLLFCTGMFIVLVQTSFLSKSTRRLDTTVDDAATKLSQLYKVIFDEDASEEVQEIQKQVRIRSECEAHPDMDTPPEGFVGTDHIDSRVTTISCVPVHYRIPMSSVQGIENSMVFGIMSNGPHGRARRDSIRKTWGEGNTLFFLVAGDWTDVEDEYNNIRDILWIDQPEQYRNKISSTGPRKGAMTFKSEAFFIAMYNQVLTQSPNVKYFFKTDDDCYVNVNHLEREISAESEEKPVDYWGECHELEKPYRHPDTRWYVSYPDYPYAYYPKFCSGLGYVLSPNFLECAVGEGHVEKVPYLTNEDGTVGILAEKCGMEPSISSWLNVEWHIRDDMTTKISVQHNVKTEEVMMELHGHALAQDV